MSFILEQKEIDLGTTSIENIFINDFMPSANGTYVKVYLLGYKLACDHDDQIELTNKSLSGMLQLPLSDILMAWTYWEDRGLIKKQQFGDDEFEYNVEFLSLRQLYVHSNFVEKSKIQTYAQVEKKSQSDRIQEANNSPTVKEMFYKIDQTVRRPLVPNERMIILDWMDGMNMDPEIIVEAYIYAVEVMNKKNVNYVASIIRDWYDKGLVTKPLLDDYLNQNNIHFQNYKKIYRILGFANKTPSMGHKEIMDVWLKSWDLPMDFLERALIDASKRTSNVNLNYLHTIIKSLYEANVRTLDAYLVYLTAQRDKKQSQKSKGQPQYQNNKKSTNKFHNFSDRGNVYSNDELEKKLGIKK